MVYPTRPLPCHRSLCPGMISHYFLLVEGGARQRQVPRGAGQGRRYLAQPRPRRVKVIKVTSRVKPSMKNL